MMKMINFYLIIIVFSFELVFGIILFFLDYKTKKIVNDLKLANDEYFSNTSNEVNELGFSISLIGLMGKGKTTI